MTPPVFKPDLRRWPNSYSVE